MKKETELKIGMAKGKCRTVTTKDVEQRMIVLRKQPVLLDTDVAELYGVETKRVNEAVRNNPKKFPSGYIFELDKYEKIEVVENFDHLKKLKFSSVSPTAFTERGLYMLATILKSEQAVNTTLAIVDTFVRVRELARTMEALQEVQDGGDQQKTLLHRIEALLSEMIGRKSRFYLAARRNLDSISEKSSLVSMVLYTMMSLFGLEKS